MKYAAPLLSLCLVPSIAFAATRNVPTDHPTVTAALTAAAAGDVIVLADGTYTAAADNVVIINKAVTITSQNGRDATVISGGSWSIRAAVTLNGLTFTAGNVDRAVTIVNGGNATIAASKFHQNTNGAIEMSGTTATISGTDFTNNSAPSQRSGGAIYATGNNTLVISDSAFVNNRALSTNWGGGAIYLTGSMSCTRCAFRGNQTNGNGGAIAVVNGGTLSFTHSTFSNNAGVTGGVIYASGASSSVTTNTTIASSIFLGNYASHPTGGASGDGTVYRAAMTGGATATLNITNATFFQNAIGTNPLAGAGTLAGGTIHLTNVILQEDSAPRPFSTVNAPTVTVTNSNIDGFGGSNGNIDVDANGGTLYVSWQGSDFRLAQNSPCRFTGRAQGAPATDITGMPWTGGVSMGAYAAQVMNGLVLTTTATATQGEATSVRIDALDQRGVLFPAYAGTVQVSSTDTAAVLPASAPLTLGTLTGSVTWSTLGTQTLTVRDSVTATITATAEVNVLASPAFDLALSITDGGNFVAGAAGTLSLDVRNIGNLASSGDVSVTVQLPAELTRVSASGEGWTCDGATCSRNDGLAIDTSYPPITVAVTIATNAPASTTTAASVTSTGDANAENDSASHTTAVAPATTTPPPGGGDDDGPGPGTGDGNTDGDGSGNDDDTSSSDGGCAATNPMAWTALAALAYFFCKRSDA